MGIEKENFESRRQLIEYDSVLNHQRIIVYALRKSIIAGGQSLMSTIEEFFIKAVEHVAGHLAEINHCDIKNTSLIKDIYADLRTHIKFELIQFDENKVFEILSQKTGFEDFGKLLYADYLKKIFPQLLNSEYKIENVDEENKKTHLILEVQKWIMLEILDHSWRQHIVNLDQIKEGISLRSWGQKSPLIEYKQEAFLLFKRMTKNLVFEVVGKIGLPQDFDIKALESKRIKEMHEIEELLFDKNTQEKNEKRNKKNINKKIK